MLLDRGCLSLPVRVAVAPPADLAAAAGGGEPRLAGLAAGACAGFLPTGRDRGRTVLLDPGHGGPDPGVLGRTGAGAVVKESAATMAIALELAKQLRAAGYRVVLSRTKDSLVAQLDGQDLRAGSLSPDGVRRDLLARVRCANASNAAAIVSIHLNGYPDASVGGTQTIYDSSRPFAAESRRLAQTLQSALVSELRLADRGVVADDALDLPALSERAEGYGHLVLLGPAQPGWADQATAAPGALVEPLFLTAPAEAAIAASSSGQRRIATALGTGLKDYFGARPQ